MQQLHSYLSGAWVYGQGEGREIRHAVTGEALYESAPTACLWRRA